MNLKTHFFSIIVLVCLSANVQASVIKHIYEVTLPVISQDVKIRQSAFEQAFIEVVIRVSGTSLAPTQLDLKKSARLVSQYRYKVMPQDEIDEYAKQSSTTALPQYKLWVQFDDGKVKKLLTESGLPVWGYQRPNVLVWLAVQDGPNRYLLKHSDKSQIKDAVIKEAKARGLPLIWPKFDVQDRQIVQFIDVWGKFVEPIKLASKRYAIDGIIIGRMKWSKGSWVVNWSLIENDENNSWQLSSANLDLVMKSGVGVTADQISNRFAVFADNLNEGDLLLRISNLNSIEKYAAASKYLRSLAPVTHVYASQINKFQVDFHLELNGDEVDLKRIIALGKVLVPDTQPEVKMESKIDLQNDADATLENKKLRPQRKFNIIRYKLSV